MRHMLLTLVVASIVASTGTIASQVHFNQAGDETAAAVHERERAAEPLYLAAVRAAESAGDLSDRAAQKRVLESLEAALDAGACPTRALTDAAFTDLHTADRFRQLIRDHARQWEISMTVPGEPGDKLRVSGVVRDAAGKPVASAAASKLQGATMRR